MQTQRYHIQYWDHETREYTYTIQRAPVTDNIYRDVVHDYFEIYGDYVHIVWDNLGTMLHFNAEYGMQCTEYTNV